MGKLAEDNPELGELGELAVALWQLVRRLEHEPHLARWPVSHPMMAVN